MITLLLAAEPKADGPDRFGPGRVTIVISSLGWF